MFEKVSAIIDSIRARDASFKSAWSVILGSTSFHALCWHRVAYWCQLQGWYGCARFVSNLNRFFTGMSIDPSVRIGQGVVLMGTSIHMGEGVCIGDEVTIYGPAYLGPVLEVGVSASKAAPIVETLAVIEPQVTILGAMRVPQGTRILANTVWRDVPQEGTACLAQASSLNETPTLNEVPASNEASASNEAPTSKKAPDLHKASRPTTRKPGIPKMPKYLEQEAAALEALQQSRKSRPSLKQIGDEIEALATPTLMKPQRKPGITGTRSRKKRK